MKALKRGFNQINMQEMNRSLLLHLLRKKNICARAELAKNSGLKQATVTNIVNDFLSWGIVKEVGTLAGEKGRRSIGISLNDEDYAVVGVQLTRKHFSVGLFHLSGKKINDICKELNEDRNPREIMDRIISIIKENMLENNRTKILAIGMAIPGPYSVKEGRIELMTGYRGWENLKIQKELEDVFDIPVFLEQDANAGAVAQHWYDNEKYNNETFIYISYGQGVGSGVVIDGRLLKGAMGMAGEIGHMSIDYNGSKCMCGNRGCLEGYCSSISFTREVNRLLAPVTPYKFAEVQQLVRDGDIMATELYLDCCDYLAVGITNLVNIFNPSVIVIGDEMAHVLPEIMLNRIKEKVKANILPILYEKLIIRTSKVEESMLRGAAIVAINDIFSKPIKYFE